MAWYMEFWLPIPTQEHNTETQPVCTAQRLSTNKVGIRWGERTLARSTRSYSASASEFPRKVLKVSERGDWDWDLFGRDVGTGIVQQYIGRTAAKSIFFHFYIHSPCLFTTFCHSMFLLFTGFTLSICSVQRHPSFSGEMF